MRIRTARIHHYRSIRDLTLECGPCMVLLGPNNHGKSNVIGALDFFFSSSSRPTPTDFFHERGDDRTVWVDLTFYDLSEQEKKTFEKYFDNAQGEIQLRKLATLGETGKVEIEYHGWLRQPKLAWLREANAPAKKEDLHPELMPYLPEGRYSKAAAQEAQRRFIAERKDALQFEVSLEEGPLLGRETVASGCLPEAYLVPAVRDLSQDTVIKTTTLFGRLLNRAISEMAETDEEFRRLRGELAKLFQRLNRGEGEDQRPPQLVAVEKALLKELQGWEVKIDIQIDPPDVGKVFELGTTIHVDDGVRTRAEDKGHGLQRAMIFALTTAWAEVLRARAETQPGGVLPRGRSESVMLFVEEPELFLHPHAQRRLEASLRSIARSLHHQVFVCTHSPQFVNMDDHRHIAIIHKPSPGMGSCARQCTVELFAGENAAARKKRFNMAAWINPDRAEMFFARRVAFVEGATETAVIPFLAQRLNCCDPDVSVIDCGSKFNLPLYMEVAGAFGLDHFVIHDEDPVDDHLEGDKLKAAKDAYAVNAEILALAAKTKARVEMLRPDFETVAGVSKSQGEKKGKPLAAIDHFDAILPEQVAAELRVLVEAIYAPAEGGKA